MTVGCGVCVGVGVMLGNGVIVGVVDGTKVGVFVGVAVEVIVAVGVTVGTLISRFIFTSAEVFFVLSIRRRRVIIPEGRTSGNSLTKSQSNNFSAWFIDLFSPFSNFHSTGSFPKP